MQIVYVCTALLLLLTIFVCLYNFLFARSQQSAFRFIILIFILVVTGFAGVWNIARLKLEPKKSVLLLISIDGLHPSQAEHYFNIFKERARVKGVLPTLTYPSHTTIVTGVHPSEHGIYNNVSYDPQNKNAQGWYWYARDIQVPTFFQKCQARGLRVMNVQWPVTVGERAFEYTCPQIWRAGTADDLKLIDSFVNPSPPPEIMDQTGKGDIKGIGGDAIRYQLATNWIYRYRPDVNVVYFGALDHNQHQHGPHAMESTLMALDRFVSGLCHTMITVYGNDPQVQDIHVCLVSDHGFAAVHTEINVEMLIRTQFPKLNQKDVYFWSADGCCALYVHDKTAQKKIVHFLQSQPHKGIQAVLTKDDLQMQKGFPGATCLVALEPGYLCNNRQSTLYNAASNVKGTHGYLPRNSEMDAVFFHTNLLRPSYEQTLQVIQMTEICRLLERFVGI